MKKEEFIKKWGSQKAEFSSDLLSVLRDADYYEENFYEEDEDKEWDQDEEDEKRYEEDAERAATCVCDAWQFNSKGMPIHVADCYCGAE